MAEKKQIDKNKYHKNYMSWKKEQKKGYQRYMIDNVVISTLLSTAVFALVLCLVNITLAEKVTLGWVDVLLYVAVFLVVYGGLLFALYHFGWQHNLKKYAPYEEALIRLAEKKRQEQGEETAVEGVSEVVSETAETTEEAAAE